jgi:hypothetical protein
LRTAAGSEESRQEKSEKILPKMDHPQKLRLDIAKIYGYTR